MNISFDHSAPPPPLLTITKIITKEQIHLIYLMICSSAVLIDHEHIRFLSNITPHAVKMCDIVFLYMTTIKILILLCFIQGQLSLIFQMITSVLGTLLQYQK
jgi:hypothetical protein